MHKLYSVLLLAGCLTTSTHAASTGNSDPPLFIATYKLYNSGLEIAAMERNMRKTADNEYVYHSSTRTIGLVAMLHKDQIIEKSSWEFDGDKILPRHYNYSRTKGKKNRVVDIQFDWDNGHTRNLVHGQNLQFPLSAGTLDKLLYQYAIMRDAANGQFPVTYHIADGSKMKQYEFERITEEPVTTPLGDINAIKIQSTKSDDNKTVTIWCAPSLNYLPVKVEHNEDGSITTAILQTVEWQN